MEKKTVCPKCGAAVTANCRQQERTRKEPIVILQQYGSGWIERQFRAICRWSYGEKKEIRLNEEIRAIIPEGQQWGKVWYGTMYNADEFEQEFWDKNGLNKHFLSSYLYPGDLPETLKRGSLEHSGMICWRQAGEIQCEQVYYDILQAAIPGVSGQSQD